MIIEQIDKTSVERSGDVAEGGFGIADISKAFHALTTQIYNNPAYSVISEICANAYDSHIQAGCADKPFYVHLPSALEPFFAVRDYGISMTHKFMMDSKAGYCAAFFSTKGDTNEANGAFGIGRLTLLALRDTYTAICYLDGKKRTYTIFKEFGSPRILFLGEEESAEPQGFEASVEVANANFDSFAENAKSIFRFYPIAPDVRGSYYYYSQTNEYIVKSSDEKWAVCSNFSGAYAVMGVYAYPIEDKHIRDLTDCQRRILSCNLHLRMPLGSISVSLSRDGLFYDQKTCDAIRKTLENVEGFYKVEIQAEFSKCKSLYEAKKLYLHYFKNDSNRDLNRIIAKTFSPEFDGKEIDSCQLLIDSDDKETFFRVWQRGRNRQGTISCYPVSTIPLTDGTKIFVDKKENRGVKRRIKYLHDTGVLSVTRGGYGGPEGDVFTCHLSDAFIRKYGIDIAEFPIINDVTPTAPPRVENPNGVRRREKSKYKYLEYNHKDYGDSDDWDISNIELKNLGDEETGAYVLIGRYRANIDIAATCSHLHEIGFDLRGVVVMGIRDNCPDILQKFIDAGWIGLAGFHKKKRDEILQLHKDDIQEYADLARLNYIGSQYYSDFLALKRLSDGSCPVISDYVDTCDAWYQKLATLGNNKIIRVLSSDIAGSPQKYADILQKEAQKIKELYPLLKYLRIGDIRDTVLANHLGEYLRFVQSQAKV